MRTLDLRIVAAALAIAGMLGVQSAAAQPTGEQLYNDNCAACHQKAGQGIPGAFPALKGDKIALGDEKAVASLLLTGRGGMPAFKDSLSDAELRDDHDLCARRLGQQGQGDHAGDLRQGADRPAAVNPVAGSLTWRCGWRASL